MSEKKQHILVARPGYAELLAWELAERWEMAAEVVTPAAAALAESITPPRLDELVFARQLLPRALRCGEIDQKAAVEFVVRRLQAMLKRANRQDNAWTLHVFGVDDDPAVQRALKLEKAVKAQVKQLIPRFFERFLTPQAEGADAPAVVVVQLYLVGEAEFWLSTGSIGSGVSPNIGGVRRMRHREGAPSRSARKLEEAFYTMGREPAAGETAVDLGAAPGGWSFLLASHGANVQAIDHAELELPPMKKNAGKVEHLRDNGLKFMPPSPVDWLCCDMVIASRETLKVLERWLERRWMKQFVVNVKFPSQGEREVVREALALLARFAAPGATLRAKHLYHDRREITLMGWGLPQAT